MSVATTWLLAALLWGSAAGAQKLNITFLDVGQGDAALVRSPTGRNVLIDAGPNPAQVADWLRRQKIDTVHLAIASHNHADHIGGMARVLETVLVLNYMENGMPATTRTYGRIVDILEEQGITVLRADPRRVDLGGGAALRVLPSVRRPRSQNDASIGIEITYGRFRALFTGDAEEQQRRHWARTPIGQAQLLKVSHHGSENGTDAAWLAPLRACAAVVSVGARNSFNHPSPRVLALLGARKVSTYRTDRFGHVGVVADSTGAFEVSAGKGKTSFTRSCQIAR